MKNDMKIKTFSFLISNYVGNENFVNGLDENDMNFRKPRYKQMNFVYTQDEIDSTINRFCESVEVVDVKVNTYTIHRHNNSRCDSVIANYTILYK